MPKGQRIESAVNRAKVQAILPARCSAGKNEDPNKRGPNNASESEPANGKTENAAEAEAVRKKGKKGKREKGKERKTERKNEEKATLPVCNEITGSTLIVVMKIPPGHAT